MISIKTKYRSFTFMPKFTISLATGTTNETETNRNFFYQIAMLFCVWKPDDQHLPCTQNLLQASGTDLTGTVQRKRTTFLVLTWMFLVFFCQGTLQADAQLSIYQHLPKLFSAVLLKSLNLYHCRGPFFRKWKIWYLSLLNFRRFLLAHLPSLLHPCK